MSLSGGAPATPTTFVITATLPSTALSLPAQTPPSTTAPSSVTPIEGTTATQLNVRAAPSTASAVLGMIAAATKIQILGKDASGNWYEIAYPSVTAASGWVTAQYVDVKDRGTIPVADGGSSGSGTNGVIIQQVNVRSGPGTKFKALGTLNPKDVVSVTGKDASGIWLRIHYPPGADSTGWITGAYVQTNGMDKLSILAPSGDVVGTGTATSIPLTITPTLIAAPQDNDSAQSPAVQVTFSPSGARSLIYSSDVSSPEGDAADWIEFTPYGPAVKISLTCSGNGTLKVEVLQNSMAIQNAAGPACGETTQLDVSARQPAFIRLYAASTAGTLEYIDYTLRVESVQP